jgi:outer membrane protein insertion porin family
MTAGRIEADPEKSRLLRFDMEASAIPAELLARLAGLPPSAPRPSGTVRASAHLHAREENSGALSGSLALTAAEMDVGGLPLTDVKASAELGKDDFELKQAAFTLFGGSVRAAGRMTLAQEPARGTIDVQVEGVDLAEVDRTYPGPSISGLVDAGGRITVGGTISVEGKLTGRAVKIAGIELGQAHGSVGGALDHLHIDLSDEVGDLAASAELTSLSSGEDPAGAGATALMLDGTFTVRKLSLERVRPLLPPGALAGLEGETAGQVTVHGSLRDPAGLELHARLDSLSLTAGDYPLHSEGEVSLTLMDRFLTLAPMRLMGEKTDLTVGGSMNLREGYDLTARVEGSYDLGLAEIVIPDMRASGPGTADLRVVEHGDTLTYGGTLTIDGGSIVHPSLPLPLQNIKGHGHFNEEGLLQIDEIRCDLGGGQAAGAGWARFDGARIPEMHLAVTGSGIRAEILPELRAFFDADVTLDKDHEAYRLGGQVKIQRAIYSRPFGIEASAFLLRSREFAPETQRSAAAPTIYLDFDITADGDVWIRNQDALIEAAAHLSLEGTLDKPELSGRISALEGGTYRFRGITYRIVGGSVDFVDVAKVDPAVDIEASTRVQEYEVTLRITGRFSKPVYELTSDPPLPRNQIVWLLLTGHTLDESGTSITQGTAEAQVAAYLAAGPVTGVVSAPLEKYLGVSSVQIDPVFLNGTADPSARITLTKQVASNLRMIYSTSVGQSGEQIYQIEYNPGRIWDLLGTRDIDGSIGADVRFRRRWGIAGPLDDGRAANGGGAGAAPPARLKVGRIQVVADHVVDSEKSLIRRLPFDAGSRLDRGDLLEGRESLRIHYVTHGYPGAQVEVFEEPPDPPDPCCINVRYAVRSGPSHSVRITGDVRPRPLRKAIKEAWMEPVVLEDLVSEARRAALGYLKAEGLYAAQVDAELDAPAPDRRVVKLKVDPGEKVEVRSISFAGNGEMPEDRIRRQILTGTGGGLSGLFGRELLKEPVLLDDIAAIRSLYVANGYLSARVAPPSVSLSADGKKADVTILIQEGARSLIGAVSIEGEVPEVAGEKLIEATGLAVGQSVGPEAVSRGADSLREMLDLEGYYRARVTFRIEGPSAQTRVVFSVAAGDRARVADVLIEGNTRTNTVIVKREITTKKGDYLSRSAILTTQQNLYKLGVFRSAQVVPEPIEGRPGFANVRVKLQEGPLWLTAWGLGYDNMDGPRASFEVANNNLFGTRRSAGLFVRASAVDQRLQINLRDPNLFTHRIETLLSGFAERQDFDSYNVRRFGATTQLTRKFHRDQVTVFGRYRLEDVNLYDLQISEEETGQQTVRLANIAGSVADDTRDDIVNPKSGGFSSFDYRLYQKAVGSEEQFARLYASSSFYKEIGHGVIWASSVTAGLITSRDIPISERFFAGGDTTLRGFSYNSVGPVDPETGNPIGGQGLFLLNQELRIPLYKALKSVVFFDAGNVFSDLQHYDMGELRHDVGVGIRIDTPVGPFRVEYGRKLERENHGEDLGQLFFSIGQAF